MLLGNRLAVDGTKVTGLRPFFFFIAMEHYRILYKQICFSVTVHPGSTMTPAFVLDVAPVAKWMKGKDWKRMALYWLNRGAEITQLNITTHDETHTNNSRQEDKSSS